MHNIHIPGLVINPYSGNVNILLRDRLEVCIVFFSAMIDMSFNQASKQTVTTLYTVTKSDGFNTGFV